MKLLSHRSQRFEDPVTLHKSIKTAHGLISMVLPNNRDVEGGYLAGKTTLAITENPKINHESNL